MPEKCRVSVCGFDPMLVRGYVKTGFRALWWYLPDSVYEEYNVQIGDVVKGTLHAVYNPKAEKTYSPEEKFEWKTSNETGFAVTLPSEVITKYELTEYHFIELTIEKINDTEVWPGEERQEKWWPDEKMKLSYWNPYIAP